MLFIIFIIIYKKLLYILAAIWLIWGMMCRKQKNPYSTRSAFTERYKTHLHQTITLSKLHNERSLQMTPQT